MRFGTTLPVPKPPLITEIPDSLIASKPLVDEPIDSTNVTKPILVQPVVEPPFLDQLIQKKPKKSKEQPFDIVNQLKNMHVEIPLFQAIKDIPIYGKSIREACLKKPGRKKKDPTTVHVV